MALAHLVVTGVQMWMRREANRRIPTMSNDTRRDSGPDAPHEHHDANHPRSGAPMP